MDVVVETDLGQGMDDFLAICYLSSVVDLRGIIVSPGTPDQIALAKFLVKELGLSIPIAAANSYVSINRCLKRTLTPIHVNFLKKYDSPSVASTDNIGSRIVKDVLANHPDTQLLVIGPPRGTQLILEYYDRPFFGSVTVEGGFLGYGVHGRRVERMTEFEGKSYVPSYNLNACVRGSELIMRAAGLSRRFVCKNVCHTVFYDRLKHDEFCAMPVRSRGSALMREMLWDYLKDSYGTLLGGLVAACCLVHPEIGTWVSGKLYRQGDTWGGQMTDGGDMLLIDADVGQLWECVLGAK